MTRAIHPQTSPVDARAVRWVTDTSGLPVGVAWRAPGTLGPLMEYGVLTKVYVERGGVWTWLSPEKSWTEVGPRIREAVADAVDLAGWQIEENSAEVLEVVARDVLEGELGSYIASHGGAITVVTTTADALTLDFGGACEDCPAAGSTMHDRIESAVKERYPGLKSIGRIPMDPKAKGFLGLPSLRARVRTRC